MSEKKKGDSKKKRSRKKTRSKIFKGIYIILIVIILGAIAIGAGIGYGMIKTAPEIDVHKFLEVEETSTIYDNKGTLIDEFNTPEKRISVSIDKVPKILKNAFISIEDERFYSHKGIDIRRLGGAFVADVKIALGLSDGNLQGASTITQQLVKYRYFLEDSLTNRTSIKRKVQEMYLAHKLEEKLTKDQILESYMNTIFLGGSAHGIEAASQMYFNKSVDKLTIKQAAFIAGAAQNPSVSFANAFKNYKENIPFDSPRTKTVLGKMLETGNITQAEYDEAMAEDLMFNFSLKSSNKMNYEYFSRPVIEEVAKDLMTLYGYNKEKAYDELMYGGYRVYTTMDKSLQDEVQQVINDENGEFISPYTNPNLQASAVIMDYKTGEVKCIIGGRGDQPANSYNRAASDNFLRAPGSSLKPLTVYAPAIDSRKLTAGSAFEDAPIPTEIGAKYNDPPYDPKNSPDMYRGYVTMRDSIRVSANTVAVRITDAIGLDLSAEYGEKFGVQLDAEDKSSMAALALGQLDAGALSGTNPLTMSSAYGAFGNGGIVTKPRLYTKVVDRNGKTILESKLQTNTVLSPESAYIMFDMLKEPIIGTGPSANFGNMPIRGKTGTASNSTDLWFTGLTPYYSCAVWMGNDDYTPVEGMTSDNPSALWGRIMAIAHRDLPYKDIERPANVINVDISRDSGTLPTDLTYRDPRGDRVYSELFISGTQPTTLDDVHVEADVVKGADGKYYLPSENTPKDRIERQVFITRDYASDYLQDSQWVLPTEKDPTKYDIIDRIKDKDKDKDKGKNKDKDKDKDKEDEKDKDKDKDKEDESSENDTTDIIDDILSNLQTMNFHRSSNIGSLSTSLSFSKFVDTIWEYIKF
ncbi:MAG: PBP1A family penicillin-binding protein [Clostridium argentinense]|uniref:transglycosylase domain-containing protein n=1 Tax=Clostridium butanoliproducens TaxID=2991837 RepID=UPI001D586D82|nr:PBP1A family penicillin-binding protein [Clostridium butanoliproducens]MBS5822623.1 PBP1A family penicillin-binding protein [Clostridium argentinense]